MTTRFSKQAILLLLGALLLLSLTGQTFAADGSGMNLRLSCTGFTSAGSVLVMNRDNTATGHETFEISAVDGAGNIIFTEVATMLVGSTFGLPDGQFIAWQTPPVANPLVLTITSVEGNGFAEDVVYRRTDNCQSFVGLDILGTTAEALSVEESGTASSPSTPLNAVPETAVGINNVSQLLGLSGYGIVNTDNLNMRSGDGIGYTRVGRLNGGTELIMLGRNDNETWWFVQAGDLRGWVSAEHIVLRGDLSDVPVIEPQGQLIPPRFFPFRDITMRVGPNTSALGICTIQRELEYAIVGQSQDGDWYQILARCPGDEADRAGWVPQAAGVLRDDNFTNIPITD
ncbi:MAG: SH3 domain-containing protein [Chloroflexi bacterium]|nr:MAG: SH3 domain-containing protein [Chloroflexota bacterium]